MAPREGYLLEFQAIGNAVKVCAIDPRTGTEVSIVGPANQGQELLSRTAVRKLEYVMRKRGLLAPGDASERKWRRGLLV